MGCIGVIRWARIADYTYTEVVDYSNMEDYNEAPKSTGIHDRSPIVDNNGVDGHTVVSEKSEYTETQGYFGVHDHTVVDDHTKPLSWVPVA